MGESSRISWTDHTFNPWIGCTKVSPACDFCYAERDNERWRYVDGWGSGAPRRRTAPQNWSKVRKWNREAEKTGYRPRIMCGSLMDVLDNEVPDEWRTDPKTGLWALIRETPNLRWMLITKRIGNALKMLPTDWPEAFPHVGFIATISNQQEWDRDFRKLISVPAAWRGVSAEPLLGPIVMGPEAQSLDWLIVGGESGPNARPMQASWAQGLRDQCKELGIAFHMKQWGEWIDTGQLRHLPEAKGSGFGAYDSCPFDSENQALRVGRIAAGCLLDGVEYKEFPPALMS